MTQKEVTLDGGPPWGFRMHGGVDSTTPLKVSRVNPGSKAAQRGIREGDFITSINDLSTKNLTNNEAHNLLKNTGSSTLKLGLNKDIESSPKKTQYRTLHQETHEKTIKRSSVSYTLKETIERSSSRNPKNNEFISSNQGTKQNGSDVTIVTNIPVSQNSTSSSSSTPSTLVAEGKNKSSDHAIASRQSSYSNCSSIPDEGLDKAMNKDDEGKMSKSKKRRQRRKNLQNKQHDDVETTTIILHPSLDKLDTLSLKRIEHKYKVESPKELKKLKAKSKSLDDDDLLNIQEVSEASENEDHTNIIISEASSEENLLDNELISPAEEQELRTFLDGLNLVNSPEESAKDLYERTSGVNDSKAKKIQKRKELEEYFMPIAQNPRYLDAISEEASDISDKECSSSLRHLKQGTPELNNNKVKSCIEEPILVETIKEDFVKADEAELVYLDDLSTSSSDFDEKSYDFQIDSEETISTEISSDVKVCSKILRPSKDGSSSKVVFDYTRIPNVLKPKEPEDEKELKNNEQKTITKSCMNGIKSENLENNDVKVLVGNTKEICEEKNESKTENTKEESIKITSTKCTTESKKESTLKQMIMTSNNKTDSQKLLEFKNIKMLNDEIKEKINRQELVGPLFRKSKSPSVSKELPGTSFVQRRVEEFSNVVEDNKVDNEEPDHSLVNSRIKAFSTSEGSILKRIILEEDSSNNINNNEEEKVIIEEQNKSETNHKEFIIPIEIEATNNGEERIIPIKIEKDVSVENYPRVSENSILNNFTEDTQDMNETLQYIIKEENPDNNFSKNLKHINESLQNIIENQPKEENRKNYKEIRIIPVEIIDNFKGEIEEFLKSNNLKHINESLQNIIENEEEQEEFEKSNKLKHINESLQNIIEKPSKAENNRERIIPVEIISNFKEELEEFKKSNNLKHINESLQNIMEKQPKEENEINNEEGIIPVEIINNSKEELGEIKKSNNLKHINESSQNIIEKQFKEENNKEKIISIEIINNSKEELEEFKKSNNLKHINESLQNMIEKQSKKASNEERIIPVEIINNSKEEFKKSNNESIKNIIENQPKKENQNKNQESDLKITNEPPVPPPRKSKAFLLRKTQKDTKIPVSNDITYTNILSPPRPASASSDSTTCSEESSRCTAKYNPNSSIADVASISEFCELKQPETLRNITLKLLISLPFGEEMLKVLADASCKTIENLIIHNNLFKEKMSRDSQEDRRLVELHEKFLTKNRLLTIIQEEDSTESSSSAKNLTEWLTLARNKSKSTSNLDSINNFNRFDVGKYPHTHSVQRRRSLPQEIYEKQLIEIMEKEREIQRELEQLEEEKRKLQQHKFQPDEFYVSKNGDFAERKDRPLSMPVFPTEFFRQQMYEEYMDKFSAREERKQQKLIKISSSSNDLHQNTKSKEIIHPIEIEQEFMDKVKEKFHKDVDEEKIETVATLKDSIIAPVLVLDGDKLKGVETLPKHLQEFVDDLTTMQQNNDSKISVQCDKKCCKEARRIYRVLAKNSGIKNFSLLHEIDASLTVAKGFLLNKKGIWSPGHPRRPSSPTKYQRTQNDPQSPIWTPKSASTSPTVERKEFRPVNFQSPVLSRKTRTRSETIETPDSAVSEPPWSRIPEGISDNAINLSSTLDRRLPTSQSSPGFGNLSPRLPRAQNPTITLLQKAREGQLPRGAHYIADQDRRPPNDRPPIKYPGEVLYHIRNEYTSESDSEKPRKMADLSPRKFEGIGPVSKDGMPLILRSEVKDKDQSKWYKRMYDTIHKQKPHRDEYVTIRYKQKRAQYPYSSGYLSEPEPGAYDSDFTEYKYQTLDRRRTPQTVHFNSSTMNRNAPESRSYSSSDVLKNTQPGRIENYRPGHSSISEKEAKQWWDEVMDIFDGHLEQQSRVPPQKPRSFINQALKESGYESDSTLVFKRKEETAASQISPKEQREAYKTIQKGGDVPFQGLRKLAPERPKETDLVEFCPISPTLTKIRIHKSIIPSSKENVLIPQQQDFFCYPASTKTFANFKHSVDDSVPLPPKRKSSRNNSTLRLISTMKVKTTDKCKRHETCFTSSLDKTKVSYLKDKISCKLSPAPKRKTLSVVKKVTASPEMKSKITSTLSTSKDPKTFSRKITSSTRISSSRSKKSSTENLPMKTFGTEKKKFDLALPTLKPKSEQLLSPTEVKKGMKNIKKSTTRKPATESSSKKVLPTKLKPDNKKSKNDSVKQQKDNHFFRNLFLRDMVYTAPKNPWLIEKTNQLSRRRPSTTEPSVGAMKTYLKHIRPVSDSKFINLDLLRSRSTSPKSVTFRDDVKTEVGSKRSKSLPKMVFTQTSRPISPMLKRKDNLVTIRRTPSPTNKLVDVRRSSSPQKLYFTETTRPISPDVKRTFTPPIPRSPSCRKIMQLKLHKPQELTLYTCPDLKHSNTSLDSFKSEDLFIEPSEKFRDLNHFYNDIEKVGKLEQTFSLKPRKRCENEIIDYDRWMEVRARERAEHELKHLYNDLKHHEKEKGFLYLPKDIQRFRWKKELDRGLRIKEKSVENIKEEFERLKKEETDRENSKRRELAYSKDTYKPLWRGNSVINLANILTERRSQSEGRVKTARQKLLDNENLLTHGIGSRIWSSLSMEQVNNLKRQLQEIYGEDQPIKNKEFIVEVPKQCYNKTPNQLTVRRNSESSMISEDEKKLISQTISKEVLEKINQKRREDKLALPLVIGKEMLGAIATKEAKIIQPLTKTNALLDSKPNSFSETDSTDESTKTVVNLDDVQKKVEYFEKAKDIDTYVPTIYKASEDVSSNESHSPTIHQSKSCQNFKEYFGETDLVKFATLPLAATRKSDYSYTKKPHLRALDISPIRTISEANSFDSLNRSRSVSPYYEEAQALTKKGEVKKLNEFFEDFFGEKKLKRSRSENDVNVDDLRRKYEYPGRGRSRIRRGMISPIYLKQEDRYMPHINIISKIASLYSFSKNKKEASKSIEELAEILGCPVGEVEKMKLKFDKICKQEQISLMGHMYTSSPNIRELRDITPYLTANWIAHKFPRSEDNTRSVSSPEMSTASRDTGLVRRDRPSKKQSILKASRYTKEPDLPPPPPPPKNQGGVRSQEPESPRKYVENEVTIHYKSPVRTEIKEYVSEDELAHRQAEAMKKIYEEERKRKYLQVSKSMQELHDMKSRRHTDNFIPSQKPLIPLNRYDDFDDLAPTKTRPRSPEPRLVAKALYNFVGQTARELTFRRGDLIYVRRQVDKNWYEGELNAMVGLFPVNYVEIVPYEGTKSVIPRKAHEGQARAKFNFVAQTHLELSLAKGELVTITRKVDDNWFEGKIGGRKGIFPVAYVDVLIDPSEPAPSNTKPVASPAAHSLLLNGSASMGSHLYTPSIRDNGYHHAKPVQLSGSGTYSTLPKVSKSPVEALHIETQSEPIPYRALYKYTPQNDDELELLEGDTVYVLEKCDDGWYVGSSDRTGAFGTFPGNYVEKI